MEQEPELVFEFWKKFATISRINRPLFHQSILEAPQYPFPTVLVNLIFEYLVNEWWELSTLTPPNNTWTWQSSRMFGQAITVRPEATNLRSVEFRVGPLDASVDLTFLLQEWDGRKIIGEQLYSSETQRVVAMGLQKFELDIQLKPKTQYLLMLERSNGSALVQPCPIDDKFHRDQGYRGVHSTAYHEDGWENLGGGCLAFRAIFWP